MTDAEKMREAAAQACDRIAGNTADFGRDYRRAAGQCAAMIRALPIPDASAPAAGCQQAGLVTVDAQNLNIVDAPKVSIQTGLPSEFWEMAETARSQAILNDKLLGLLDEVKAALEAVAQHDRSAFHGPDAEKNRNQSWRGVRRRAKAALARLEREVG